MSITIGSGKLGVRSRGRKLLEPTRDVSGEIIDNSCTSLEHLVMHGTPEHFLRELQTAKVFIAKLTTRLEQLELDGQTYRIEDDRLREANVRLQQNFIN